MDLYMKRFHFWVPAVLLLISIVLFSFLMEELIDASPPICMSRD